MITIQADSTRLQQWIALRNELWPGESQTHRNEVVEILEDSNQTAFLLIDEDEKLQGFIEGQIYTSKDHRYGHVEGWFVTDSVRGRGYGRKLMEQLEQWFLHHAIGQVYSDTIEKEYPLSKKVHLDNGYSELFQLSVFVKNTQNPV